METSPTVLVVTYCSREKDPSAGLLPAVDRYVSSRVRISHDAAAMLGVGFRILSGLYGLLEADREIPDYDHLLTSDQVPHHTEKVEQQLRESAAERLIFVTRTMAADPGAGPYREAISQTCSSAGVVFEVVELGSPEPSAAELANLIRPFLGSPAPWTIYLIHHSHTDIGYTELQGRITRWHVDFIRQALEAVASTRGIENDHFSGFKWQCECFWQVERFLEVATAEERENFLAAIKEGRIGISGSYLNFNELLDGENLLAVTRRAANFSREFGVEVNSAMTADINGYSWGFAQTLLDSGIGNLFTCIHTHHGMYPLGSQQAGFWWETPKGEKVLVWSGEHYHFGNELGLSPGAGASYLTKDDCSAEEVFTDWWTLAERRIPRYLDKLKSEDYPFAFVPVMISGLRTDNGPPNPLVAEAVSRWNTENGDVCRIEMATLDDFFARLRIEADILPTYRGDWPDWWSDGPASYPQGTRLFRQAQRDLALYRALCASRPQVKSIDPDGLLEKAALQELAMYAEHTFSHQDSVSRPGHYLVQAISGVKQARAAQAVDLVTGLLDRAAGEIGGGALKYGSLPRFKVINPWDQPLRKIVRLTIGHHEFYELGMNQGVTVRDIASGEILPWWRDSVPRGEDFCVWLELEPGEERVLELEPGGEPPTWPPEDPRRSSVENVTSKREPTSLENDHLRIDWEPGQGITAWVDKISGREILRSDRTCPPFTLIHEKSPVDTADRMLQVRGAMGLNRKSEDVVRTASSLGSARPVDGGPIFSGVEFEIEAPGISHGQLALKAMSGAPRVEIQLRFLKDSRWEPENLYLALPFTAGSDTQVWLDKTGGAIRPRVDQIPGSLTDFYSVQAGMMCLTDDLGILIATPDSNLIQLGSLDHGERLLMGDPRLADDPAHAYAWLMTNYWETNFGAQLGGFHEFRFIIEVNEGGGGAISPGKDIEGLVKEPICIRLAGVSGPPKP